MHHTVESSLLIFEVVFTEATDILVNISKKHHK